MYDEFFIVLFRALAVSFLIIYILYRISVANAKPSQVVVSPPRPYQPPLKQTILQVDPQVYEFLESRKLEANIDRDFSTDYSDEVLTYQPIGAVYFNRRWKTESFSIEKVPDVFVNFRGQSFEENHYYNHALYNLKPKLEEVVYRSSKQAVVVDGKHVLIGPYFFDITLFQPLNVYMAYTHTDTDDYNTNVYNIYYFDRKGRYLFTEKGPGEKSLPSVGFRMDTQEIVHIAPLPEGNKLEYIVNHYRFVVSDKTGRKGIIDNEGHLLLGYEYRYANYHDDYEYVLLGTGLELHRFHIETSVLEKLPYSRIYTTYWLNFGLHTVHVFIEDSDVEWDMKWGLIDFNGNELIKPVYDCLDGMGIPDVYRVFKGKYKWTEGIDDADSTLQDYIEMQRDPHRGKLDNGKWGLLDKNGNELLPVMYDWIESISKTHCLINLGGTAHAFLDHQADGIAPAVIHIYGGLWGLADANGNIIEPITHIDPYELGDKYSAEYGVTYFNEKSRPKVLRVSWDIDLEMDYY